MQLGVLLILFVFLQHVSIKKKHHQVFTKVNEIKINADVQEGDEIQKS